MRLKLECCDMNLKCVEDHKCNPILVALPSMGVLRKLLHPLDMVRVACSVGSWRTKVRVVQALLPSRSTRSTTTSSPTPTARWTTSRTSSPPNSFPGYQQGPTLNGYAPQPQPPTNSPGLGRIGPWRTEVDRGLLRLNNIPISRSQCHTRMTQERRLKCLGPLLQEVRCN